MRAADPTQDPGTRPTEITGKATVHVEQIPLKHGDYEGVPYSTGKVTPGEDTHDVTFAEGNDESL